MILTIWQSIQKFAENVKQFFLNHPHDPVLWIGIVLLGLIIFEVVYQILNKER